MTYLRRDLIEAEVEIEKGCTKARYALMNVQENNAAAGDDNNNTLARDDNFMVLDADNKIVDYANVRATNIPTCQRIFPPKPTTIRKETIMQNIKDKMLNAVKDYKEKHCNNKGVVKMKNIDKLAYRWCMISNLLT